MQKLNITFVMQAALTMEILSPFYFLETSGSVFNAWKDSSAVNAFKEYAHWEEVF